MTTSGKVAEQYYVSTLAEDETIIISDCVKELGDVTNMSISNSHDYWVTASSIDWSISATPFAVCMPNLSRVNQMCDEYPALAKAFENFKTIYAMVEQDWEGKKA